MKPLAQNSMIQNRYLIVQPIGKGGMGEVYLAIDQRLGSAVALKRTFFNEDEALGSAFEREARILARLRHPVLPKVIDHFIEDNDQFLVMEHISGDDLAKRLENAGKPFPLSWVMFWADQMLDALHYLHSHEPPIVHRDIKPQNLKLTDENHIVLLDFGLSKDFATSKDSLNSASVAGYSPHFASMEQIRGTGTDARSDLYSLSATLYQLMTNTSPVDALSRADALLGGEADPIIPLNELNPEVTPAISDVILKGVGIRQGDRFETAAEMQKELRRAFAQGKGQTADPTARLDRAAAKPGTDRSEQAPTTRPASAITANAVPEVSTTAETTLRPGTEQKTEVMNFAVTDSAAETVRDLPETVAPPVAETAAETKTVEKVPETVKPPVPKTAAAAAGGTAGPMPAGANVPQERPATASAAVQPVKKKSNTGLILAGLLGLFFLLAVVAAGGWFAYTNFYQAGAVAETPSPEPTVQASPTPAEPVLADIYPPENSNSAVLQPEVTADETNTATGPAEPAQTRTNPLVTTKATPAKAGQPPVKAKPTPKKRDDRTVIEQ